MIDGTVHWFGTTGLANGLAVLGDEQTWTSWDHMTGEAFDGPLKGHALERYAIRHTTAAALRSEDPDLRIQVSDYRSLGMTASALVGRKKIGTKGFIPPTFYASMSSRIDPRLPKLTNGLGVLVGDEARYYPMAALAEPVHDPWQGRVLTVSLGPIDGVPRAVWADGGEAPMQLFSRWYGFSFNWPGCAIHGA